MPDQIDSPPPDVLVAWPRHKGAEHCACHFSHRGAKMDKLEASFI
jgi:hypothetical protein